MSSPTWTTREVASSAGTARLAVWRAVEAQHPAATTPLVDSVEEQRLLEHLLDEGKPPLAWLAAHLEPLLSAPFRYPPPAGGSRFRGPNDPGVFYAADEIRTACAELGYWRWRHLLDTPTMSAMPTKPQSVFETRIEAESIDLRMAPFLRERKRWTHPRDYAPCQAFARTARSAGIGAIRYESVRDPERGGCCSVLSPSAVVSPVPSEQQAWLLSVSRTRVVWQRMHVPYAEAHEFRFS